MPSVRDPSFYVSSLVELAGATSDERRALWRQAMASLARTTPEGGPGPLEGLHPDVLLKGAQTALYSGLADDLDWLSPSAAGVALYTLAAALPASREQRELGRRVLARMLTGNAETFAAIAAAMAQTASKALSSAAVRSRIALVCELPLSRNVADGALALSLVSRRDSAREWVGIPSTRSLAARRLSAKLLERAAREAARRAQMGDPHALRFFSSDVVSGAYQRLITDRESLVWRYVAVARGLAAGWIPELEREMRADLADGLSPTEWRRAVASLAAYGAVRPDEALKITLAVVKRGLFKHEDPPSAAAFVWGIPRTIEAEPEAASRMLEAVLGVAVPFAEIAEAVCDLRLEYGASAVVERSIARTIELLRRASPHSSREDDGAEALLRAVARDLEGAPGEDVPLRVQVGDALDTFRSVGAAPAHAKTRELLTAAKDGMDALTALVRDDDVDGRAGSLARRASMGILRDLDMALLERNVVADLLRLGASAEQVRGSEEELDAVRERLAEWVVTCETPDELSRASRHPTLRLRRLRALLHLVDGDLGEGLETSFRKVESDPLEVARARRLRALWLRTVQSLLEHVSGDPLPAFKRTLLAALARALDALVRFGVCDVVDALLVIAERIRTTRDVETLAEASMDPDLRHVLLRYSAFLRHAEGKLVVEGERTLPGDSILPPPSSAGEVERTSERLHALSSFADDLTREDSARSEALRTVLVRLHACLSAMVKAKSLRALLTRGEGDADVVDAVETWTSALVHLCAGARSRLAADALPPQTASAPTRPLSTLLTRVLDAAEPEVPTAALGAAIETVVTGLPHGIGRFVAGLLWMIADLPPERPSQTDEPFAMGKGELPPWLPARRTIGGFYVHRALGIGGTASVFVVTRVEDRKDPSAERFALKVPDYDATAARSVSQDQFLRFFREEASALITLPNHTNLARFVTFDMGARPMPILVMELVEGVTLERVLDSRSFDMNRCLTAMDDILAGLEAMHTAEVGHLDLKPSNVVLRRGEQAVLVDFGLAGRNLRPGCGTGPYGAPEVWGVLDEDIPTTPMSADIYSFGCLAFEMLTGRMLFAAPSEVAQIVMHASHDGLPLPMQELVANPEIAPLAEILVQTLRRDPRHRPSAEGLRAELRAVASMVEEAPWPIEIS